MLTTRPFWGAEGRDMHPVKIVFRAHKERCKDMREVRHSVIVHDAPSEHHATRPVFMSNPLQCCLMHWPQL